ncbi:MAG: hypothetical protein GX162_13855 [Firmicutes bacterium]|nr:hypothetical protein [Bacillota bacterium]
MDINERKFSESFELYDNGEAILLLLLRMGQLLDAHVSLDPLQLVATAARSWDGLEGLVDLQRQIFYWGGEQLEMSPEALLGPGDFFVPVAVIERLMDVQLLWRTDTQTLLLTVDGSLSLLRSAVAESSDLAVSAYAPPESLIVRTPPLMSLGIIQYVLNHESITRNSKTETSDDLDFSAHWQMGGIPVDVVIVGNDIMSPDATWELKRVTAT